MGINYAPDSTGIAPYNTALAESIRDAGAEVHVITGLPHYPEWKLKDPQYRKGSRWAEVNSGVKVTRLRHHIPSRTNLIERGRMEASFLARAASTVRGDNSDVIIAVTPSLSGLAAGVYGKKRRPLGVVVQDLTGNAAVESGTTGGSASRAIANYEYSLLRKADTVGVITPQFGRVLTARGVAAHRIADVPNFTHITPTDATKDTARRRLGWPSEDYLVVHTGNMGMKQGLETVVDAARLSFAQGSPVTFVLVGDGNQRSALKELAGDLPTLRFVDPLNAEDYPFALAAADALLLNERPGVLEMSLPSKLTSYSSANRAIIAAVEPSGITHAVLSADSAALMTRPGSAVELLNAATLLADDIDFAVELGKRSVAMHKTRYSAAGARSRYVSFAQRLGDMT
ncbi:colanic acid biosynthesis glycosyl transferase WcaI [Microbacteriaceae bacterium SG_E_30_P1]|uniref:D-inositol 3-phosphate glycosyltransferase n=1 Tax=Antiquaquibacter oligotrophicus TaxID=2880260 RepID=A0ABT6KQV7_9MICO|nr:glycosyltransferase family 4 protein [Antiquaquibacter oligotrophicus]MDH6181868.1 colanic acid biosynthesis glycosyl transferase WcaI [Antiquaquibacter oligotrophicus]UDF12456.1 glycosyltransferase family 4 protein [Antiquaquibacter oligotrophicus]